MTILEAIQSYYRVICATCHSYFDLSTTNYTKLEVAHILTELGWQIVDGTVRCPDCEANTTINA